MASASLPQFDPEEHGVGVYEKFQDLSTFMIRYQGIHPTLYKQKEMKKQTNGWPRTKERFFWANLPQATCNASMKKYFPQQKE